MTPPAVLVHLAKHVGGVRYHAVPESEHFEGNTPRVLVPIHPSVKMPAKVEI